MSTMPTDDELDDLLAGAGRRLHAATADLTVGEAPSPSFPTSTVLRVAAAVAVVGGTTAGLFAVARGDDRAGVPVAFTRGDYGTEIVLRGEDDGDGNPNTYRLVLDPGGQSIRVLAGAAASTWSADPTITGCWELDDGTGICGPDGAAELNVSRSRGPDALAIVLWVPDDVTAVAFEAGSGVRHWSRPVGGTAAFPFPSEATSTATATLVRADGTVVDLLEASDRTPTDTERVGRPTDETLESTPAVYDPPAGWGAGASFVRTHGRLGSATGFDGPFVLQTFTADGGSSRRSTVEVLTVNERGVEDAQARLSADRVDGSLRLASTGGGVSTFVWAGTDVGDDVAAAFLSAARPATLPADAVDLDKSYSWLGASDRSMNRFLDAGTIDRLLFDRVATVAVDGVSRRLLAGGDDAGVVQYWFEPLPGSTAEPGRGTVVPGITLRLPAVGDRLSWGLWAVPPSTRTLTITLDDGTTFEPQLVDVRPLSDAKLAMIPAEFTDRTVEAVTST